MSDRLRTRHTALSAFAISLLFTAMLVPSTASAGYYDVCGTLQFFDTRERPANSAQSLLGGATDLNRPAKLVSVFLFDQDGSCNDYRSGCSETDDDYLGSAVSSESGGFCFNQIGDLEDIYYLTRYSGSGDHSMWDSTGSQPFSVSVPTEFDFGNGGSGTYQKDWNITCTRDDFGVCDEWLVNNYFPVERDIANIHQSAAAVDIAISDDSVFHLNGHSGTIHLYYPDDGPGGCSGSSAEVVSCQNLCIPSAKAGDAYVVAHEVGHVLQFRALNSCGSNFPSIPGCGSHQWDSWENEKCATTEGWANFVAGATWWLDWKSSAYYLGPGYNLEGDVFGSDSCVSESTNPHRREGNVARYFWDLFDSTTVDDSHNGYTDNVSTSLDDLIRVWDDFPAGSGNRQAFESDDNGVNVHDYAYYDGSFVGEKYLNCLGSQDWN